MTVFLRFQTKYVGRTGAPVGVFVAVDHLRRTGRLSEEEITCYAVADAWFQENLPNPPFYEDGNSIGAITWFRESADSMTTHLDPLLAILDAKEVAWERLSASDPGRIVYQDPWQVGVIPASREPLTPLPYPGKPGPNDWFKVRKRYL
ncbi:hypothetical protein [Arthrobacter sp. OY3WO11]|uniref:hypothetical protein n=1 Tax=Arthrobacter sp. OY3WO11 TaxID=1835723 RepID=UPI0007CF0456|nr:hypothetical protein [Arthrobacter sp. OY3WO11]OAE00569.1 hypothetical protein A6A22_03320 [Arthrobacter sp. OY3WO11]